MSNIFEPISGAFTISVKEMESHKPRELAVLTYHRLRNCYDSVIDMMEKDLGMEFPEDFNASELWSRLAKEE